MERKKDELLNFAFNEQDNKLKFYRETLVEMTKVMIGVVPNAVEQASGITKAIMNTIDEYENSFNYQTQVNENSTITANYPNFFNKGVNPDFLKTEPIRTIVDNDPQYQPNQKSYGTLGEHWKELMDLFEMKNEAVDLKEYVEFYKESKKRGYNCYHAFQDSSICAEKRHKNDLTLKSIADSLGIEFIEDFVKACEKCED